MFGANSWQSYQDAAKKSIKETWSEILTFRAEMSSK